VFFFCVVVAKKKARLFLLKNAFLTRAGNEGTETPKRERALSLYFLPRTLCRVRREKKKKKKNKNKKKNVVDYARGKEDDDALFLLLFLGAFSARSSL